MFAVSIPPHANFGLNDYREDAPHFKLFIKYNFGIAVCATHKRKLCYECQFNKICAGKKECNVFKNDEFQQIINQGMETIDKKIQEAIDDINAHGSRIKNLFKKDPINNKIDDNWKLNLKANDMLMEDQNESCNEQAHKNKTTIKSVPLKNSQKNDVSHKTNRTLRISNLEPVFGANNILCDDSSEYLCKADVIKGHLRQSYTGKELIQFNKSELKKYLR